MSRFYDAQRAGTIVLDGRFASSRRRMAAGEVGNAACPIRIVAVSGL